MAVDHDEWSRAVEEQGPFFASLAPRLPADLEEQRRQLIERLH